MPHSPATTAPRSTGRSRRTRLLVHLRASLPASGALAGAALALAAVALIGRRLGAPAPVAITFVDAAIVLLSAVAVLIPILRPAGLLLTWNALGVSLALLAIGLVEVGALVMLPVILIALGLTTWPRREGDTLVSGPALIAAIGGALILPLAYALTWVLGWLAGFAR